LRVKWTSTVNRAGTLYQPETPSVVKRELVEKEIKPQKARYRVSKGAKYDVSAEVVGKPAIIKEAVVRNGSSYSEQHPESFERVKFDVDVSELQDYGDVKYYRSEHGKLRIPKNAVYYDAE
jgi:hypothetical protein